MTWDSLLSGAVGGLVITFLTFFYDQTKVWIDQRRERKGLLLLLESEINHNGGTLEAFEQLSSIVNAYTVSTLSTDVWEASRARLTQLLTTEHIEELVAYYASIRYVQQTVNYTHEDATQRVDDQVRFPAIQDRISMARNSGDTAKGLGHKYLNKKSPSSTGARKS